MAKLQISVLVVSFAILSLRLYFYYQNTSKYINGQFVSFETTLLSQPQISKGLQKFTVSPDGRQKIFITTSAYPQFFYGDIVRISGIIKQKVLTNKNVVVAIYFPKIEASKNKPNFTNFPLAITKFIRQKVTSLYQNTLPQTSASLLLGIVFGFKEQMPKTFTSNLQTGGVMHVIAASGMNVTMVGGFLSPIFAFFFRRQYALLLTIFGILFYATLAGLEASIVRAAIMGILAYSAQILGRQYLATFGLFLAGYIMIFINPDLLTNVGFQLSFSATMGLIFISPIFVRSKKNKELIEKSVIGQDVVTIISAQVATLPIMLSNFGTYSIFSILVNGLVLWTIPILMILGALGAILSLIFVPLGQVFLYACLPFLMFFEKVVNLFGGIGSNFSFETFPFAFVASYYLILVALLWPKKSS